LYFISDETVLRSPLSGVRVKFLQKARRKLTLTKVSYGPQLAAFVKRIPGKEIEMGRLRIPQYRFGRIKVAGRKKSDHLPCEVVGKPESSAKSWSESQVGLATAT